MLFDFGSILILLLVGAGFVFFTLFLSRLLSPRKPNPEKASTYECGERILGPAWIRFNIRFYVIALIFIIFAVEIAVLFPCAVVYRELGWIAFIEIFVFVFLLLVGLAYLWYHGDLEWIKTTRQKKSEKKELMKNGADRRSV